jgi:aconitate hydratase
MGVLPLQFKEGTNRETLKLDGSETLDITGLDGDVTPGMALTLTIHRADGSAEQVPLLCRIDTVDEVEYFRSGGILQYVLNNLAGAA